MSAFIEAEFRVREILVRVGVGESVLTELWSPEPIGAFTRIHKLALRLGPGTRIRLTGRGAGAVGDLLISTRAEKAPFGAKGRQQYYVTSEEP